MAEKRIFCYGDSNTWGYAEGVGRLPSDERWTGVCQRVLGDDYKILEHGIIGRTAVMDDPAVPFLNGKSGLGYALRADIPIDLAVVMLGTNDLVRTDAAGCAAGCRELAEMLFTAKDWVLGRVWRSEPKVLILSPIVFHPNYEKINPLFVRPGLPQESRQFAPLYEAMAKEIGAYFLDAAQYASPCEEDGVHIRRSDHPVLGRSIAEKIREILE